jgi:hypothetical protein
MKYGLRFLLMLFSVLLPQFAAAQGQWTIVAPMSTPRLFHGVATGLDGRIYVIGGQNSTSLLNSAEVYDPIADTWISLPTMSTARDAVAVAADLQGRIYAIGGYNGQDLNTVEVYNPNTNAWISISPMATARRIARAATGLDGRIYVIGGWNDAIGVLDIGEVYDPIANAWTNLPPMSMARQGSAVAAGVDGRIYVMGGEGGGYTNSAEVYDPLTNTWSNLPPMLTASYGAGAATGSDGRIYVIGGGNAITYPLDLVQAYNPLAEEWTSVTPTPIPRLATAASSSNGKIYIIGGGVGPQCCWQASNSVQAFTPPCSPPTIDNLSANPNTLWPPNHKMVSINISGSTSGGCGTVSCQIANISSNEPLDPDGDWTIINDLNLKLRAERLGKGTGRIYTIGVQCTDSQGNKVSDVTPVVVPHDKGK